jgi:hypothetical protein
MISVTNQKFQSYSLEKSSPSVELSPLAFAIPRKVEWLEQEATNGAKIRVFTPSPLTRHQYLPITTSTVNTTHISPLPIHTEPYSLRSRSFALHHHTLQDVWSIELVAENEKVGASRALRFRGLQGV